MTEPEYAEQITSRCESLGTWREEFASTRSRLAKIYVRIDVVEAEYERTGAHPIVTHTNKVGAKNAARNPFLVELDTLLNLDGRSRSQPESVVAKSTRPSVLEGLKRPMPPRNPEKKSKQHEEVR